MTSSEHEDYLLRQLKGVAVMLARILGLRTSGMTEQAAVELDRAYGLLLGSQSDLIRKVDTATAAALLSSAERILALAQLTAEEAEQQGDGGRAAELRLRAVELGLEAASRDPGSGEVREFLARIAPAIEGRELSDQQSHLLEDLLRGRPTPDSRGN